jgi:hypothetical protein
MARTISDVRDALADPLIAAVLSGGAAATALSTADTATGFLLAESRATTIRIASTARSDEPSAGAQPRWGSC